jgi:hypothetical protein
MCQESGVVFTLRSFGDLRSPQDDKAALWARVSGLSVGPGCEQFALVWLLFAEEAAELL